MVIEMNRIPNPIQAMLPTTADDTKDLNQSLELSNEILGNSSTVSSIQPAPTILDIWNEAIRRVAESNKTIEQTIVEFREIREYFRTTKVASGSKSMTLEEYYRALANNEAMKRSGVSPDDPRAIDAMMTELKAIENGWTTEKRNRIQGKRDELRRYEEKLFGSGVVNGRLNNLDKSDRIHLTNAVTFILFFFYRVSETTRPDGKLKYRFPRIDDLKIFLSKQQFNFPDTSISANPYCDDRITHFIATEITNLVRREQKTKAEDWPNYDGFVLLHFWKLSDDSGEKLQDLSWRLYETEIRASNHSDSSVDWLSKLTCDNGLPEQLILHARQMADLLASCSCKCFADAEKRKPTKAVENQCFQRHRLLPGNLSKAIAGKLGQTKAGKECQDPFAYLVKCIVVNLTAKYFPRENLYSLFERTYKYGDIVKYEPLTSKSTFNLHEGDAPSSGARRDRDVNDNVFVIFCNDCNKVLDDKLCSCKRGSIRLESLDQCDHNDTLATFDCNIRGCQGRGGAGTFWLKGNACSTIGCKKDHPSRTIRAAYAPDYLEFFLPSEDSLEVNSSTEP